MPRKINITRVYGNSLRPMRSALRSFNKSKFDKRRKKRRFNEPATITKAIIPKNRADTAYCKLKQSFDVQLHSDSQNIVSALWGGNFFTRSVTGPPAVDYYYPLDYIYYANLYSEARILASKITVTCINQQTAALTFFVFPHVDILDTTGSEEAITSSEVLTYPFCKRRTLASNGGINKGTVTSYMTSKKMFGNIVTGSDDYVIENQYTSQLFDNHLDPDRLWHWYFGAWGLPTGAESSITAIFQVTVEYHIRFEEPRNRENLVIPSSPA